MEYRKLNIDPHLAGYARAEARKRGIGFETAGDGRLMAPITEETERELRESAERVFWQDKDGRRNICGLTAAPGREKDLRYEFAVHGVVFAVRDDGSFAVYGGSVKRSLLGSLVEKGILSGYAGGWDEACFEKDVPIVTGREECATTEFLRPYVEKVLRRDGIAYRILDDCAGLVRMFCEVPWTRWVEAVVDALCERQREIVDENIPVYSFRTLTCPEKLCRLQKINGTDEYDVLWCDRARWARVSGEEFVQTIDKRETSGKIKKEDILHALYGPGDLDIGYGIEPDAEEKKEKRRLNISPALTEYAETVLGRDGVPYDAMEDGSLMAALSDEEEDVLIEDAMCEEQRLRVDPSCPVYSWRTIGDHAKHARLQRLFYGMDAEEDDMPYYELEKDEDDHLEAVGRIYGEAGKEEYTALFFGKPLGYEESDQGIQAVEDGWSICDSHSCRDRLGYMKKNRSADDGWRAVKDCDIYGFKTQKESSRN